MPEMKPFTYPSHSQTKRKPMKSEVPIKKEDNLEQEMNELFSTSSRASPADLFNVCGQQENDHQIDAIIKEIDNYHQPAKKIKVELDQENIIVKSKAKVVRSRAEKSKLKHSSWPYIYHLQKTNLRDVLTEVAENHIKYEKVSFLFLLTEISVFYKFYASF